MCDKKERINCVDIYAEEIEKKIKNLEKFRNTWLWSTSEWDSDIFQYADPDFYFYRFVINRLERGTESLLKDILCRLMERYGLHYDSFDDRGNRPFVFIIHEKNQNLGYRFIDFNENENVNDILKNYHVDFAYVIRKWKAERCEQWIIRENQRYKKDGVRLLSVKIEDFFNTYFARGEYDTFKEYIDKYLKVVREITGFKSVKALSSMNLSTQKIYEEKMLSDWGYKDYKYQIVDKNNGKLHKYLYLIGQVFSEDDLNYMENNYLKRELFRTMVGSNEYAESFITSEWLFHSLKETKNYDYTAVVSGYLKSLEQLLYRIVMFNVNNNCKISINTAKKIRTEAKMNNVVAYRKSRGTWSNTSILDSGFVYVDFISEQVCYMDNSIGTFEYFLRYNPHVIFKENLSDTIADMVCCFRTECRNGYFHTHNLNDWDIVEKIRDNAIYLYFVLLGACIIPTDKEAELMISESDSFDELCNKIVDFTHYNLEYIFEYEDGRRHNLIYDSINNIKKYTDDGLVHYDSLQFYAVDSFSPEDYDNIDKGVGQKIYLTRDELPRKIYGVYKNKNIEEIVF